MNVLQNALLRGLAVDVLDQTQPELPVIKGNVIALSDYGKSLYDDAISWTSFALTANFIQSQDSPFLVSEYGTVQIIEEPRPVINPIHVESCKVSFNHLAFKRMIKQGIIIDWYSEQLRAKVQAWDERLNNVIIFGVPSIGVPGLLSGSGVPLISSTVNLSTAPIDAVINEVVRVALTPSINSINKYKPTMLSIPQDLYNILNTRNYSSTGATTESVLDVILLRLNSASGYADSGLTWSITSVPQFNSNKLVTVLPNDAELIGAAVYDLESFVSPGDSEGTTDSPSLEVIASSHDGGFAGVMAKRPLAGVVAIMTY